MAEKQIRLGYPKPPGGTNYSLDKYRPSYEWGRDDATNDNPTRPVVSKMNDSEVVRNCTDLVTGSNFTLESIAAYRPNTITGASNLWKWGTSNVIEFAGTTNPMDFMLGQPSPNFADTLERSWQRGVVGFSMEHVNAPQAGAYGHYIDSCTLLYRKLSDTSKFHVVDVILGGNLKDGMKRNYASQTPFKSNTPRRDGSRGGFYCAIDQNHASYDLIQNGEYVFMGVHFRWGSYEAPSQFQTKLQLYNMRLIFNTKDISDTGARICHPKMLQLQYAAKGNKVKLTYGSARTAPLTTIGTVSSAINGDGLLNDLGKNESRFMTVSWTGTANEDDLNFEWSFPDFLDTWDGSDPYSKWFKPKKNGSGQIRCTVTHKNPENTEGAQIVARFASCVSF